MNYSLLQGDPHIDMTSEELKAFMNTYTKIMIRIVEMGQKLQ